MTDNNRKTLSLKQKSESATKVEERLQKVLAQAGLGSRRALEERIAQGLVKLNGEVASIGQRAKSGDRIELDGRTFVVTALTEDASVLILNKPEGVVTTNEDPEGRPTVFESLPRLKGARWIAVGRLDINTTGLLLLTTDGELANALMHPSNEVPREYVCRIQGEVPENIVERLARGVALDDGTAKFEEIERIGASPSHAWFRIVLKEGRNREVRRMWESQGYTVSRLKRTRYGEVGLPRALKRGHCEEMKAEDVAALRRQFALEDNAPVLTLQPVIGQRRSKQTQINIDRSDRGGAYVNGQMSDEASEFRRFDNTREERPASRRPAGRKPGRRPTHGKGPKRPFHGPMDGARADAGPRRGGPGGPGGRGKPSGPRRDNAPGNPTEFKSWYVPEGVDTGSKIAPPRKPRGEPKPFRPGEQSGADRGPRKPYGGAGGRDDARGNRRGPRPEGEGRGPYRGPSEGRGPRPQGEGRGPYRGPSEGRGPRPEGRGPRPEGRGPRPEGDNRGPRRDTANRGPGRGPYRGPSESRGPRGDDDNRGNRKAPPRNAGPGRGPKRGPKDS